MSRNAVFKPLNELEAAACSLEREAFEYEADARASKKGDGWQWEFDYRDRLYDKARISTNQARRIREEIASRRKLSCEVILVSRHSEALDWLRRITGADDARAVEHVGQGDIERWASEGVQHVMGVLTLAICANAQQHGVQAWVLEMDVPPELRGAELTADQMADCGAKLVAFNVRRGNEWENCEAE